MISTEQLYQLVAFEKHGSLSGAAEELMTSQPSLSRSMRILEEDLDVALFDRQKNKLSLNENGKMAVTLAKDVITKLEKMQNVIREFDRENHEISLGSCAPVPIMDLEPLLKEIFPESCLSCKMESDDLALWKGLKEDVFQIIIVHDKPTDIKNYFCFPYRKETLSLLVPREHPLAGKEVLHLDDFKDQNILIYTDIGFWAEMAKHTLTDCHFLYMNEPEAFANLAGAGAFPSFVTDAIDPDRDVSGKVIMPIDAIFASAEYYFVCKKANSKRFRPLTRRLRALFDTGE